MTLPLKNRLLEKYIIHQKSLCLKYNLVWQEVNIEWKIGLTDNLLEQVEPINGLRHPEENGTTGWYFWAGEDYSHDPDWFKPYCVKHLVRLKPILLKYLALPPGFRILIDTKGYEDIWFDESLLIT